MIRALLRGPAAARLLAWFGIDPKRYWLLMDLFQQLSERREFFSQLGRDDITLKVMTWVYCGISTFMGFLMLVTHPASAMFLATFLGFTAFLLFTILIAETSNSLVNPVEALVLAHHPINGATYTAAKLSHLFRAVTSLMFGLNLGPALLGLALPSSGWTYPIIHLLAGLGVGLLVGLFCCGLYGWLIRFVPAPRLKSAAQLTEGLVWIGFILFQSAKELSQFVWKGAWLPADSKPIIALLTALGIGISLFVVIGIRSLSGDYLVRVASIIQGRSNKQSVIHFKRISRFVNNLFGSAAGHAGFAYVRKMMSRDWQFRKQLIQLLPGVIGPVVWLVSGIDKSPFGNQFSPSHVVPHAIGGGFFFVCMFSIYGADYKGSWLFQIVPDRVFDGFVRGVHRLLWTMILVAHLVLLPAYIWNWGLWHAALFSAFSLSVASLYLALEFRLIDSIPFSKQYDPKSGATMLPLLMGGGLVMAAVVGIQHFLLFRSPVTVAIVTCILGASAWSLTRRSREAVAQHIRFQLSLQTDPSYRLYLEV